MSLITNELSSPYSRKYLLYQHNLLRNSHPSKPLANYLVRSIPEQHERKVGIRQLRRSDLPNLHPCRTPPNFIGFINTISPMDRLVNHHHTNTDIYLELLNFYIYEGLLYAREFELAKLGKGNRLFRKAIHTPPK